MFVKVYNPVREKIDYGNTPSTMCSGALKELQQKWDIPSIHYVVPAMYVNVSEIRSIGTQVYKLIDDTDERYEYQICGIKGDSDEVYIRKEDAEKIINQ